MTNHRLQNSEEHNTPAKRKRVLAAVAQDIVTSEDDDNVADGMDICDIIENHTAQHRQTATSNALHSLGETIRNTLLEINEIREQNRERRHKELLQILTKMVQQETESRSVTKAKNSEHNILKNELHGETCDYNIEGDFLENQQFVIDRDQMAINSSTTKTSSENADVSNNSQSLNVASSVDKTSTKYIKILPSSQINTTTNLQTLDKIKNVTAIKQDNTKEELQKMRAQMLELQRQKMEDRERKKRELLQMQNI